MPSFIMRGDDYLESERVNNLSPPAEIFYFRLLCAVDAHGKLDARPTILRTKLYALQLDRKREADLPRLLQECEQAGLVRSYEVNGKPYLIVHNFRQRLRSTSKYPDPPPLSDTCPSTARQLTDTCPSSDRHLTDTCQTPARHLSDNCPHEEEYEFEEEKEKRGGSITTRSIDPPPATSPTPPRKNDYLTWITAIKNAHPAGRELQSFIGNPKLRDAARAAYAALPQAAESADLLRAFYTSPLTTSTSGRPFKRPLELLWYFTDLADIIVSARQWAKETRWKPHSERKPTNLTTTPPQPQPPAETITEADKTAFFADLNQP